jgi:hypothetical protein
MTNVGVLGFAIEPQLASEQGSFCHRDIVNLADELVVPSWSPIGAQVQDRLVFAHMHVVDRE